MEKKIFVLMEITGKNFNGRLSRECGGTVITEKGVTDKKRFYLPKSLIDKFDGHTLWLKMTEDDKEIL